MAHPRSHRYLRQSLKVMGDELRTHPPARRRSVQDEKVFVRTAKTGRPVTVLVPKDVVTAAQED